jgi:hypothetical protein
MLSLSIDWHTEARRHSFFTLFFRVLIRIIGKAGKTIL